jgi:presenilin-like A22 family membrane protease
MKHNAKITLILMIMFVLTQFISLYVVNFYLNENVKLPYGFDQRDVIEQTPNFYTQFLTSLVISFAIAVVLLLFLMRIKSLWFIRIWFFVVISLAIGVSLNVLTTKYGLIYPSWIALALALVLACLKFFRKNIFTHNLTELLIYPGIAAIFVIMLNLWTTIILLILISIYDAWAVWKSGIMQKMAKFQINDVGIFGGFFIPYASKKVKEKIKLLKMKYKNKIPEKVAKRSKLKVGLAILGGGDIAYTAIPVGVFFKTTGSFLAALCVMFFAALALLYLFMTAEKKKCLI